MVFGIVSGSIMLKRHSSDSDITSLHCDFHLTLTLFGGAGFPALVIFPTLILSLKGSLYQLTQLALTHAPQKSSTQILEKGLDPRHAKSRSLEKSSKGLSAGFAAAFAFAWTFAEQIREPSSTINQ